MLVIWLVHQFDYYAKVIIGYEGDGNLFWWLSDWFIYADFLE